MHEAFDLNIRRLVEAIDASSGLTVVHHTRTQPSIWWRASTGLPALKPRFQDIDRIFISHSTKEDQPCFSM